MKFFDRLSNLVAGLGGGKDKAAFNTFALELITDAELNSMYRSDWLSRKIVDIIPYDMTREWRNWQASQDEIEKLEETERVFNVQCKVQEAMTRARLLGGAAIYIGTNDADLSQPLNVDALKAGSLQYLHVLSKEELTLEEINRDVRSPFFGRSSAYNLPGGISGQVRIHPSRLIVFTGPRVLDRVTASSTEWGDSVLQIVYGAIQNAASSQEYVASLIPEAKVDVIKVPGLSEALETPGGTDLLRQRFTLMNQLKSTINAVLLEGDGQTGETWEQKKIDFSQFPELIRLYLQIAAGAADIPATRLLSQSPAGLNSTGDADIRNYYDNCKARQNIELRPCLSQLDEVLIRTSLGDRPKEIYYEWAPLWQLDDTQKAEVANKKANTTKIYADANLVPMEVLSRITVNQLIEDGTYPGLQAAMDDYEADPTPPEDDNAPEGDTEETAASNVIPLRKQAATADAAPRTLYVHRKVVNAQAIIDHYKAQGFETTLPADDLHTTICFSRSPVDWMKIGESWQGEMKLPPGGPRLMDQFGDAVVLLFKSSELEWRHEAMIDKGASFDFPEYQPHITITYEKIKGNLNDIEPWQGEIILGPEIFQEVKEDWAKNIQEE